MALDPRTPILVGAGQLTQHTDRGEPVMEPVDMMAEAARRAEVDAGGRGLLSSVNSVRTVRLSSFPYLDPSALVTQRVGAAGAETAYTNGGGQIVAQLVALTAAEIQSGQLDSALLCGGEAWRSHVTAGRAGTDLPWSSQSEGTVPDRIIGAPLEHRHPVESAIGAHNPIHLYPVLENAIRVAAGHTIDEHQDHLGRLWAGFSQVAAGNPYAWDRGVHTAAEIARPGPGNRMVGFPYTKLMNSNEQVDEAAALLMCSVERARALGIPEDRWIFPWLAVAGEAPTVSERVDLGVSPMLAAVGRKLWSLAGVGPDDVGHVDLYSCFPAAVQAQAIEFGLGLDRQLTETGGMRFSGGPWNNYSMHGVARITGALRDEPGSIGLATGNGGYVSKQVAVLYSTTPPTQPFRSASAQAEIDTQPRLVVDADPSGPVTIQSYTVMHDRGNEAVQGILACITPDGHRAWGTLSDPAVMRMMETEDVIGAKATIEPGGAAFLS